jgi:hypothetical protein
MLHVVSIHTQGYLFLFSCILGARGNIMPTLNWIGKDAVVNHHKEVPFRLLKCNEKLSVPPLPAGEGRGEGGGNLLVQGDNLEALKALLPYYAGQVKCIYIDPPYKRAMKAGYITTMSTALK